MGSLRFNKKVDANQPELVALWRSLGGTSENFNRVFDVIWGYGGLTCCVGIKDGNKPKSKRKLTDSEAKFKEDWRGMYRQVENEYDVIELWKEMKEKSAILYDYYDQLKREEEI